MATRHTTMRNVYFVCARCGATQPLSEMRWQNGSLFCFTDDCVDKAIIGKRDIDVSRAVAVYRHELEPDPKLTHPVDRKNDQLDVLY
jgi:hypothetical protein